MKLAVFINNYNYARYLEQAVLSVVNQSRRADQIIIVDDGSTDHSLDVLASLQLKFPQIQLIKKSNGGQLSAFNSAMPVLTADIVTFLDSDDWYEPGYLQSVENHFGGELDYLLSSYNKAFNDRAEPVVLAGDIGTRYLRSVFTHAWAGVPTSGISIRTSALAKILPYDHESDWTIRADEIILHSCMKLKLKGAYLEKALVNYRVHDKNVFTGRNHTEDAQIDYSFACKSLLKSELNYILKLPEESQFELFCEEFNSAKKTKTFSRKELRYIADRLNLSLLDRVRCNLKIALTK